MLSILLAVAGCGREEAPRRKAAPGDRYASLRADMVAFQIEARGVDDPKVLDAMRTVPRHEQTISQPYIVASMTEELRLKRGMKVLEIGTGSGYQAAVLAEITLHVFTIEIKEPLARRSTETLKRQGYETVRTRLGDGYYGWEEEAPFDAIIVTAAAPHVPPPLIRQLKPGGRMVLPVGRPFATQDLRLVVKSEDGRVRSKSLYAVTFVPLTGSLGRKADPD
jgi:protein-L-isoaspartate(D-aspartate) O-methyltransferase